jgi:threonine/homoserine/homoserine lactone efflux protein
LNLSGGDGLDLDYSVLGAFALLWLAIVPTPGPNSLLIVQLALTSSWRAVGAALVGNLLGIASYGLATLFGLAVVLQAAPRLSLLIHILGGLYLLWIGARLVSAGWSRRGADRAPQPALAARKGRPFAQGILTALANVQAVFFLTSIFASVGILHANRATGLAAVVIIVVGNGLYLSLLAWLMQRPAAQSFYARYRPAMEIGFGLLFLVFGARLVEREAAAWV